jgi:hypothetical protein
MAPELLHQSGKDGCVAPVGAAKGIARRNPAERPSGSNRYTAMNKIALTGLLCFLLAATALAETAIITESWVRLRNAPNAEAKAIGIVYGNDAYPVLEQEEGWVQVETAAGTVGWVEQDKLILDGTPPEASPERTAELAEATALQRRGFREDAEMSLADIVESYPDTLERYEAIRHLLYYFPVSMLPKPLDGQVHPAGALAAGRLAGVIVKCATAEKEPLPDRFWQYEYLKDGFKPHSDDLPTESPRSSCP